MGVAVSSSSGVREGWSVDGMLVTFRTAVSGGYGRRSTKMRGGTLQLYLSSSKVVMTSFCISWCRAQGSVNDLALIFCSAFVSNLQG